MIKVTLYFSNLQDAALILTGDYFNDLKEQYAVAKTKLSDTEILKKAYRKEKYSGNQGIEVVDLDD